MKTEVKYKMQISKNGTIYKEPITDCLEENTNNIKELAKTVTRRILKKSNFKNIRIGYQGTKDSFCERATYKFFEDKWIPEPIAKVTSYEVVQALHNNKIEYGVVAGWNNIGGKVRETDKALKKYPEIKIIRKLELPVHQCLFIKKNSNLKNIETVASHIQAFKQSEKTIDKLIPNVRFSKQIDTAVSAMLLSKNILPSNTAVICSKQAGEHYGLKLVKDNIEDDVSITEFWLLKKSKKKCIDK